MGLRSDIEETVHRYAWCYDEGDIDGLVACFTPDAHLGVASPSGGDHHGHAEIRAYMTTARARRDALGQQPRHMLSGTIVSAVSPTEATSRCYMTLVLTTSDGAAVIDHAGRYLDRLVLADGSWRFAERLICVDRDADFSGRRQPPAG